MNKKSGNFQFGVCYTSHQVIRYYYTLRISWNNERYILSSSRAACQIVRHLKSHTRYCREAMMGGFWWLKVLVNLQAAGTWDWLLGLDVSEWRVQWQYLSLRFKTLSETAILMEKRIAYHQAHEFLSCYLMSYKKFCCFKLRTYK